MPLASNGDRRKVVTYRSEVRAPVEAVFPLLCPVREREWLPGWTCDMLYSESGLAEKGAVFTTAFRPEGPSVWTVTRHEPNVAIEFVALFTGSHIVRFDIGLEAWGPRTHINWTATFTSLVDDNAFVASIDPAWFEAVQRPVSEALERFLATRKHT